ncbi:MAG: hypothetical protein R3E66_20260 [bacterium]
MLVWVFSFRRALPRNVGANHTFDVARTSLALLALDVFEHVTMDLIVGGPGHTLDELEADLEIVTALGLRHASVYELTIETEHRIWSPMLGKELCGR